MFTKCLFYICKHDYMVISYIILLCSLYIKMSFLKSSIYANGRTAIVTELVSIKKEKMLNEKMKKGRRPNS